MESESFEMKKWLFDLYDDLVWWLAMNKDIALKYSNGRTAIVYESTLEDYKIINTSISSSRLEPLYLNYNGVELYFWRGNEITKEEYEKIMNLKAFL